MKTAFVPIHVRVEINGRGTAFRETVPAPTAAERTVQLVAKAQTWMNQRIAELLTEAWRRQAADHQDIGRAAVEDEPIAGNRSDAGQVGEPRREPHGEDCRGA